MSFLKTVCRLCGKSLSKRTAFANKNLFRRELLVYFEINIEEDSKQILRSVFVQHVNNFFIDFVVTLRNSPNLRPQNDHICGQVIVMKTVCV